MANSNIMASYNNNRRFTFQATEEMPYMSLAELYATHGADMIYPLRALYINTKSRFGESPVAITDFAFVNLPKHMTATVKDMINDRDVVRYVNEGNAGFMIREYVPRNYPDHVAYSVEWVDAV